MKLSNSINGLAFTSNGMKNRREFLTSHGMSFSDVI